MPIPSSSSSTPMTSLPMSSPSTAPCSAPWIHAAISSWADPVLALDPLGRLLAFNPSATSTLGLDRHSLGRPLSTLLSTLATPSSIPLLPSHTSTPQQPHIPSPSRRLVSLSTKVGTKTFLETIAVITSGSIHQHHHNHQVQSQDHGQEQGQEEDLFGYSVVFTDLTSLLPPNPTPPLVLTSSTATSSLTLSSSSPLSHSKALEPAPASAASIPVVSDRPSSDRIYSADSGFNERYPVATSSQSPGLTPTTSTPALTPPPTLTQDLLPQTRPAQPSVESGTVTLKRAVQQRSFSEETALTLAPIIPPEDREWGDPWFPYLAPIATSLLTCHGEAFFEDVVEEVALNLGVKYAFVSQMVTLDELKELDPAEYMNLLDQFDGAVPPIDGVMHNIASYPGEHDINPHAFQGYLTDCTIQDRITTLHSDLALLHPDVADCLMDTTVQSYVGLRLETAQGEVMGVIGVIHDRALTGHDAAVVKAVLNQVGIRVAHELDRLRMEANLIYARDVAESTAKNKTKFLADMSHEIRNPMNAVVGVTDILLDTVGLSDEQTQFIEVIRTSGQHLLTVINDVLDISRIDQDVKFLLEKRPLSLRKCLKDAVSLAGLTPLHDVSRSISVIEWPPEMDDLGPFTELEETNILPLLWCIDQDVPGHLMGDITRLRQVLINLCTNSLKFTQRGRVSVRVSIHDPDAQQPTIRPNNSPTITRASPPDNILGMQAVDASPSSSASSPRMAGLDQRNQMVFEKRYDVKADNNNGTPTNSKPPPPSRRRQGMDYPPPSSRARHFSSLNGTHGPSDATPTADFTPPSLKVIAPTANSLQDVQLDENTVILEFAVSDTGVGIPANKITDLFTSFSQVDISVSTRFGGTGLGLAISASLVEKMGGHIWVESTEGVGSRFTFTIPFTVCQSPDQDTFSSTTAPSSPTSVPEQECLTARPSIEPIRLPKAVEKIVHHDTKPLPALPVEAAKEPESTKPLTPTYAKVVESKVKPLDIDGVPLRILLAEDNLVNQKIAVGVLKKLGYEKVDVAGNGLEVIDKLDKGAVYDVILMDVSMPVMDGLAATKTIVDRRKRGLMLAALNEEPNTVEKADSLKSAFAQDLEKALERLPLGTIEMESRSDSTLLYQDYVELYVVALTASAMGSDRERCMEAGMDDFMTKPFVVLEMKRVLNEFMSRKRSGALQTRNEACLAAALAAKSRSCSPACSSTNVLSTEQDRPLSPMRPPMSASSSLLSLSDVGSTECQGCGNQRSDIGAANGGPPHSTSGRPHRLETPRPIRKGVDANGNGLFSLGRRSNSEALLGGHSPVLSQTNGSALLEGAHLSRRASENISLSKREWKDTPPPSRPGWRNQQGFFNGHNLVHPFENMNLEQDKELKPLTEVIEAPAQTPPTPGMIQEDSVRNGMVSPPPMASLATTRHSGSSPTMSVTSPSSNVSGGLSAPVSSASTVTFLGSSNPGSVPTSRSGSAGATIASGVASLAPTPPPLTPPPNAMVYIKSMKRDIGIDSCIRLPSAL